MSRRKPKSKFGDAVFEVRVDTLDDTSPFAGSESTLRHHLAHPEVSAHAYILTKSRERAVLVNARYSVYLDTKFWIKLRDAVLSKPAESADAALLDALRRGVSVGKVICPVAGDMISELLNIADSTKRVAAAQLVDELSLGITLRMEFERQVVEIEDFMRRQGKHQAGIPARDHMWTCPGYAHGLTVPHHPNMDPVTTLALQKAFVDHLYSLQYSTQDRMLGQAPERVRDRSPLASELNRLNEQHAATVTSWPKLLSDEFRGMLDTALPAIAEVLDKLAEEHFRRRATADERAASKKSAPKLATVLAFLFEQERLGDFVPSLAIRAYLAAGVRWDKTRRYQENDFHDFAHAVAALPYFDLFATERSLAHLVTVPLKLDQRYRAKVVKTSEELLATLPKA